MKVVIALTLLVVAVQACEHNGITYEVGDKFMNDCNECVCLAGGASRCPKKLCPPKACGDYGAGERYLAADGCNICTCSATGAAACTRKMCAP